MDVNHIEYIEYISKFGIALEPSGTIFRWAMVNLRGH